MSLVEKQNIATAEISYSVTRNCQKNLFTFERISKKRNSELKQKLAQKIIRCFMKKVRGNNLTTHVLIFYYKYIHKIKYLYKVYKSFFSSNKVYFRWRKP